MPLTKEQRASLLRAYFAHLKDICPEEFTPEVLASVSVYDDLELVQLMRGVEDESSACALALHALPASARRSVR